MNVPTVFNCICVSTCNTNRIKLMCLWIRKDLNIMCRSTQAATIKLFAAFWAKMKNGWTLSTSVDFPESFFGLKMFNDVQHMKYIENYWNTFAFNIFQHRKVLGVPYSARRERLRSRHAVTAICDMRHGQVLHFSVVARWFCDGSNWFDGGQSAHNSFCSSSLDASGNHLDALRCRFDPQLCHVAVWFWRRNAPGKSQRIRGVFESCSELAKRTQTASKFQRDAHARETHIVNFCKFSVNFLWDG